MTAVVEKLLISIQNAPDELEIVNVKTQVTREDILPICHLNLVRKKKHLLLIAATLLISLAMLKEK